MQRLILAILLLLILGPSLFAQTNYYQGKQIKSVVGFTAGGFYDRWARSCRASCRNTYQEIPR